MKFSVESREPIATLSAHVEKLDARHAPELKAEFVSLASDGKFNMVLDLTEARYCDSSGLSAVLVGNRLCRDNGGSFVICGLQPSVEKLIQISQLDRVLTITPTASEGFDLIVMEETERSLGKDSTES